MLKIAIQKSGRLFDDSIKLLNDSGLYINNSMDQLKAKVANFNAEIFFLRNSDIPQYLSDGVVDIAIIGENLLIEKNVDVKILRRLGFATCRLSIAIPKGMPYAGVKSLNNKKIATSYPNSLRAYLEDNDINADLHLISGSVELTTHMGMADAICDIVSSGSTLMKHGLEEKDVILTSEACIASHRTSLDIYSREISELLLRINSVLQARQYQYILFNIQEEAIDKASEILPVLKSPTIMPLVEPGWFSMHSVIKRNDFWSIIGQLKAIGAEGILVIPIHHMID